MYVDSCRLFTMQQDFKGGMYWDELAKHAATFQERQNFEVRRDFEEIQMSPSVSITTQINYFSSSVLIFCIL